MLMKTVESKFAIYFDEGFDELSKKEKGQMNLVIRDFSNVSHQVSSCYLSSLYIIPQLSGQGKFPGSLKQNENG